MDGASVDIEGPSIDMDGASVDIGNPSVDMDGASVDIRGPSVDMDEASVDTGGPSVDMDGASVSGDGASISGDPATVQSDCGLKHRTGSLDGVCRGVARAVATAGGSTVATWPATSQGRLTANPPTAFWTSFDSSPRTLREWTWGVPLVSSFEATAMRHGTFSRCFTANCANQRSGNSKRCLGN